MRLLFTALPLFHGAVIYNPAGECGQSPLNFEPCLGEAFQSGSRGDSEWEMDLHNKPAAFQFAAIARLIEILKNLYSKNFIFSSSKLPKIRFDSFNPNHVYISADGAYIVPVADNLEEVHRAFSSIGKLIPSTIWSETFTEATQIDSATRVPPPFQLWIDVFHRLAANDDVEAIRNELNQYYTPKYAQKEISFIQTCPANWRGLKTLESHLSFPRIIRPPIPEKFENKSQRKLFSRTMQMLLEQLEIDERNPTSRPYLHYDGELVPMDGSLRVVKLGKQLAKVDHVTVFELSEPAGYVIKYENNCENPIGRFSGILRDYLFQKLIQGKKFEGEKISPKVIWLSPPVALPKWTTPKIETTDPYYASCVSGISAGNGHVRYMVMEKADEIAYDDIITNDRIGAFERFIMGLEAVVQLVSKLKRIHSLSITHGDVHPGNVVRFKGRGGKLEFGFIDFGLSVFDAELTSPECANGACETVRPIAQHKACWLSHWNLQGERLSFRDDVFNAVFIASLIMNGPSQMTICTFLNDYKSQMFNWKKDTFFFDMEKQNVVRKALGRTESSDLETNIRKFMETGLRFVRFPKRPEMPPPYKLIVDAFQFALDLLKPFISMNDGSIDWDKAKILSETLAISKLKFGTECYSGLYPYQVVLPGERGKVTFSVACRPHARCKSVQPLDAYMYNPINFREKQLISRLHYLRKDNVAYSECLVYESASRRPLILSRMREISVGRAAAIAVRVIDIMEDVHRIGGMIGPNMPMKLCMSNERTESLELCQISDLEMFVDIRTQIHIPNKSRMLDFQNFISTMQWLIDLVPSERRQPFVLAIESSTTILQQQQQYDVPKYSDLKALYIPLIGEYTDPPIAPVQRFDRFLDLVPVDGDINWVHASSAHFALNRMTPHSLPATNLNCPMNGRFLINGENFVFENCSNDACDSTDGRMRKFRATRIEELREANIASSSLGFKTVIQPFPILETPTCRDAYVYIRKGGVPLSRLLVISADIVKAAIELLRDIHRSGTVFTGSIADDFVYSEKDGLAARNFANHLKIFVNTVTGEHLKESSSRKDDILRLVHELKQLTRNRNLSEYLQRIHDEASLMPEQEAPKYQIWIADLAQMHLSD